ncbi:hypothetical protein [Flexithrix dorotheae]|uniref:hypothetical protein n=1 Tax=Flexithrix dorotheae TaxID=70993 RepID=UPI00037D138C|nr:hypothetical protein [Flexithrix dorotheae]
MKHIKLNPGAKVIQFLPTYRFFNDKIPDLSVIPFHHLWNKNQLKRPKTGKSVLLKLEV